MKKLMIISLLSRPQWNNHGYDVAKIFGPKFEIISPVWLRISRAKDKKYILQGEHDVDANWMRAVRKASKNKTKCECGCFESQKGHLIY